MMFHFSSASKDTYDPLPEQKHAFRNTSNGERSRQPGLLLTLLRLLGQSAKKILLCGFGVAIVAGLLSMLITPYFTATASFVPPSGGLGSGASALLSSISSAGGGLGGGLLGGVKSNADLYSSMLKSHTVAEKMVSHFHLKDVYKVQKDSVVEKMLGSHTEVVIGSKDGIVSVKVTDVDPVLARDMANYYLKALRETSYGMALSQSSQQRLVFEDRLRREKDALANAEVALKENEEKGGLISPIGQTASQLQIIAQLRTQIISRETQLASLRQNEAEGNPDIQQLKQEIASMQARIQQLQSGTGGQGAGSLSNAQVPALTLDYVRLERDVKYHETLFQLIAKQYEAARLTEADDPPLQTLDSAVLPDTKAGPHRSIFFIVGFLLGAFGVVLWTILQGTRRGLIDWSQIAG